MLGIANNLIVDETTILDNLKDVQKRVGIPVSKILDGLNFSVEMETATGKTYVYLRTIYELNARYDFKKFVVVVPNVAIREGVEKSIEMTREHFANIYGNIPCETWTYNSSRISMLRQFAVSNQIQILIVNIDAFNKATNIINQENDKLSGYKPIEFIQACRPIVIIDEPQNMESDQSRTAIESLNPACTLRYSATHRNLYNLVYKLDPVRAYDLRLVKRIEVDSVMSGGDFNKPFISVEEISAHSSKVVAKIVIEVQASNGTKRKTVSVSHLGTDLSVIARRDIYGGYVVDNIDAGHGYVDFTNGVTLSVGESHGYRRDDLMRVQIQETIREHFEKELSVYRNLPPGKRLKILSLFFIRPRCELYLRRR